MSSPRAPARSSDWRSSISVQEPARSSIIVEEEGPQMSKLQRRAARYSIKKPFRDGKTEGPKPKRGGKSH